MRIINLFYYFCKFNIHCKFLSYFKRNLNILGMFSKLHKPYETNNNPFVYKISCGNCKQVYIGQTGRALNLRIKEHKYNVKTNHSSALTSHSHLGHDLQFEDCHIIHSESNLQKRLIAEALLIKRYNTFLENTPSTELQIFIS